MRDEPRSPLQAGLRARRNTHVLLVHLSLAPVRDRCKLPPVPGDLRALPSLRARLGCPAARHDASCRAFCWAVGTAACTLASLGHGFLLHHSSCIMRAHASAVRAPTKCTRRYPVAPAPRRPVALWHHSRPPCPRLKPQWHYRTVPVLSPQTDARLAVTEAGTDPSCTVAVATRAAGVWQGFLAKLYFH